VCSIKDHVHISIAAVAHNHTNVFSYAHGELIE
jgi:hypothetical protein